ncbi:hypothetical protein LINPERPRIM_LOCUS22285 [Linum perenne]
MLEPYTYKYLSCILTQIRIKYLSRIRTRRCLNRVLSLTSSLMNELCDYIIACVLV